MGQAGVCIELLSESNDYFWIINLRVLKSGGVIDCEWTETNNHTAKGQSEPVNNPVELLTNTINNMLLKLVSACSKEIGYLFISLFIACYIWS